MKVAVLAAAYCVPEAVRENHVYQPEPEVWLSEGAS